MSPASAPRTQLVLSRSIGQIPAPFVYILRCFSILEGHGLRLDRNYRIVEDCYPYLANWALRAKASEAPLIRSVLYGPRVQGAVAVPDVNQVLRLLRGLPRLQDLQEASEGGQLAEELRTSLRRPTPGNPPGTEESVLPWRDKDPPPSFDGDIEKFKSYLRELKMWRHETDVPAKKHAVKMLRALTGPAKAVCNELEVEALLTEAGADAIVSKLKEYYQPHLETAMPKAFERAVYGEARRSKESIGEFIVRQDALFRELREEGVTLDDTVRGYTMFRQSNLSQTQEDQVTTWTQGKFDRASVMSALRKLEKVQRDRGSGKRFMVAEPENDETYESEGEGDYIYLGEEDLDQIFEEEELTEALATYQQVRQAIREQRNGRGYFQPKGVGKASPGKPGKGAKSGSPLIRFGGKGTKVHIDVLKLRTKCARCGQIGHWARECVNEPDAKGKSRASSDGTSPKSGFFESGNVDGESSTFQVSLGQCLAKTRAGRPSAPIPFTGITTSGSMGIIDTAAQGGLIGLPALRRLEESLKGHGLKVVWTGKKAQAKGIGGDARVRGVVEIPVGIGRVNGVIEATVVEEEVPFLLSIQFLKQVGAIVDLQKSALVLTKFDKCCLMHHMPVAAPVLEFHEDGWQLPDMAFEHHRKEEAFRFFSAASTQSQVFMWKHPRDDEQGHGHEGGVEEPRDARSEHDAAKPGIPQWPVELKFLMTKEEMEKALQEDAPRVIHLGDEARWTLRGKKQLEESTYAPYERQVADGFWMPQRNDMWRFHHGILPEFSQGATAVRLFGDSYFQDHNYEPEEEKQLSRAFRKAVNTCMKKLVISEVFSPPWVSEYAEKHGLDVRQVRPVLNMVDWATGYQMLEPLDNTQSSHIWEKFYGTWVRTFSVPEVVITDQGREFGKELAEKVSQAGALHRVIGARAPWQQARTERHGGVAKEVFIKLRESMLPTNDSEWRMCVHAVEAAKNRLYNRPGFSPAQRQFGYNMRLPGSLGSDDVYELLIHSSTDDMRRVMEIRNTAMQEYLKHVTCRAVAKAQLARGRGSQEFKIGDVIYVYRVPLQRKRMKSEVDFEDREGRRATWVGPGVVVMVEGANAWLSIRGELWKCALEQLRHATPEEKEARSLLEGDFEELRVEMTRKASKRGFKDITQWDRPPPMVDEDDELPIRPHQRPRLGTEMEPEEEAGRESEYTPTNPAINEEEAPLTEPEIVEQAVESNRSSGWKAAVGDLKNAFMQSDKLVRPAGRLFCKQPRGGLPGLQEGQLIEILAGAYRLGDAPAHWRKSLKKALFQGGFQQSSMDPCVFKSFKDGKLRGLLAVEVDDLFGAGDEHFFQQMEALRQRFDFGKFARLEEEKAGVGFNGRRIKQEGNEFLIDMEKFVSERLNPVKLATGRATKVKEDATNEEKELVRAAVGSLTWAAKEGRPDAAAAASLTASSMNELKVQDIVDLNKAINQVRENAKLALRIQAIPMADLCWGVVTDASYANVSKGKSQGAYAVLAMDKKVLSTGAGKCNILHWRSGKIHRIVNSTLAAETQALSRGLEFTTEAFDMRRWEESLRQQRLSALVSESSERALAENISIVDAKSLYDHLSRETVGTTNDKRTALEMQIIRQTLAETRTQIKGATPQDDRGQPDKTSWKCDSVVAAFARRRAAINGCN
eukprot:g30831.t1